MVEEYLNSLPEKDETDETAVVKIRKILKGKITNPGVDWKKAKDEQLTEKYGL